MRIIKDYSRTRGVVVPQTFIYDAPIEEFAHFLTLYIHFYEYNRMSDDERRKLAEEASERNVRENAGAPTLQPNGQTMTVIPNCNYGCGAAPCNCYESWQDFLSLAKTHGHIIFRDGSACPFVIPKTSIYDFESAFAEKRGRTSIFNFNFRRKKQ